MKNEKIHLVILIFLLILPCRIHADDFPLRNKYPSVQPISTSDLHDEFEKVIIIDTRSSFEYDLIRIKGAKNILVSKTNFRRLLREKVIDNTSKVVFYCNGITCAKSYKAAIKAAESGYGNVFVYDAGVFEWTNKYPDLSVLLGKNPADIQDIISDNKFNSKLLDKEIFAEESKSSKAYLIDTRDINQRKKTPDFARSAKRIPIDRFVAMLDNENFKKKIDGKTLYIMDAVGKQARWFQYHLISRGYIDYHFLRNGVRAFLSEKDVSKDVTNDKERDGVTEARFEISEPVLELINRKISKEKFNNIREEINGKVLSTAQLYDLLERYQVSSRRADVIVEEVHEYFLLKKKIEKIAPAALSINNLTIEINVKNRELGTVRAEEIRAEIEEEIEGLKTRMQTSEDNIVKILRTVNEEQLPYLPGVLEKLGYNEEQSKIILLHIRTQVDLLKTLETMDSIIESIAKGRKEIEDMEKMRKNAQTDEEKAQLTEEMQQISGRLKDLDRDFSIVVTGLEQEKLFQKEEKETDWNRELQEVFSPLIVQLKQVTERPRQMEILRSVIVYYENLLPKLTEAVNEIDRVTGKVSNPEALKQIKELDEFWTQQEKEFTSKLEAVRHQLFELEKNKMSLTETITYLYKSVFKQRGINIFYAIIAFLFTLLIFHLLRLLFININPLQRFPKYMFLRNLLDVLLYVFSFLAAITAMVVVLYVYGNWLVLGIVIIILVGLVWTAKNALPGFVEQIKILLGFGEVRLNEKIIREGIAYRVKSIGIFSYFENPLLSGGTLRLPLRDLIEMRSRSYNEDEPWFPTRKGDWIFLSDGCYGEILMQTPDVIRINTQRGSYKSYIPKDFLQQRPQNLSINFFSVKNILNLDFRHSDIVLKEVPQKIEIMLKEKIEQQLYGKYLKRIIVELKEFDSSSLNVMTAVQFSGEAASEYSEIGWLLQQVSLAACNKYDWQIALKQVMIHQSKPYEIKQPNMVDSSSSLN